MTWPDDIARSLPRRDLDLTQVLYDTPASGRKYNASLSTNLEKEFREAVVELAHDPRLPFEGSIATLGRHAYGALVEDLQAFLSSESKIMWQMLRNGQRRLTTEKYIIKIEDQLTQQVDILREWTLVHEWDAVFQDVQEAVKAIGEYPVRAWRTRAARGWLTHAGLKELRKRWESAMQEEEPATWGLMVELFQELERQAGV